MVGYNIKLERFANGQCKVIIYDDCVGKQISGEPSYREDIISKRDSRYKKESAREWVDNPFTGERDCIVDDATAKYLERKAEHNMQRSISRTKQHLFAYSRQCRWEYFVTLTFSDEHVCREDFSECMKKARTWFNNQKKRYAQDLQYLIVPEQHKKGGWHIHGVISNVGNISFVDSGRVAIGKRSFVRNSKNAMYPTIYNLGGWRYGFSTATQVQDAYKVSGYICKYITKELCQVTKGKNRYYKSNNIPEPETDIFFVVPEEVEEFVQTLEDSLGVNLTYQKQSNGYVSATYKYYDMEREEK